MPAVYTPARGPLINNQVGNVLALFADSLPWLSHRYGLVQTATRKAGSKTERVPQVYRQDGELYHFDTLPDKSMSAMCFFERDGPSRIRWDEDSMQMSGSWSHPVSAVFWCNLPKIAARPYEFTEELAADVLRVLIGAGIPVGQVEQRTEEVFKRYTLEDKKLLMHPFAGFKIQLVLPERYNPCILPFDGAASVGQGVLLHSQGGALLY